MDAADGRRVPHACHSCAHYQARPLGTGYDVHPSVLNNRLCEWAESYSVYIESQAGFRSNMGTSDNIVVLHG